MALANRLDFIAGTRILDNTTNNDNILTRAANPRNGIFANEYTVEQIINRLQGYDLIQPDNYSSVEPQRGGWCRLLKRTNNRYEFRTGGFVLHNDTVEEFIVFLNRSLNFSFAVPYRELILFRHNPNSRNLTPAAETFVRNLMNFSLNPNGQLLVAIDVNTGNVFWTENNRGKIRRLRDQIVAAGLRAFDLDSFRRIIRQNKNTIRNFVVGYLDRVDLDDLLVLRDNGQVVDNNADERLRQLLRGFGL